VSIFLRPHQLALIAGYAYLPIFFLTPHSWIDKLIIRGDAALTFSNLVQSEMLFRVGITCWLVVLVADTLVSWALYYFFSPTHKGLSLLSSIFRLLFVAVFAANMLNWLNILPFLEGANHLISSLGKTYAETQVTSLYSSYEYASNISFIFFGIHIGLMGYLALISGTIPRFFGVFLIIASVGYQIDSFATFLSPAYAKNEMAFWIVVALPAFLSEFSFTIWLLIRGGKVKEYDDIEPGTPENVG